MEFYRTRIEDIAKKICSEMHVAVYDMEEKMSGKGRIITIYLTKQGGVSIDECASFSRALADELEEFDIIPERYFLEVSSPGIERPLKLKTHYVSAINEKVAVQWTDGEARLSSMGTLTEVNQDSITLDDRGTVVEIPFKAITRAKTIYLDIPKRETDI